MGDSDFRPLGAPKPRNDPVEIVVVVVGAVVVVVLIVKQEEEGPVAWTPNGRFRLQTKTRTPEDSRPVRFPLALTETEISINGKIMNPLTKTKT